MSTNKFQIYQIPSYEDYELHYSTEQQFVYSKKSEKYLKFYKNRGGYLQVSLCKNGKQRTFKIHQLVWMCLKGEIPKDLEINHIDENKENNSIENLELVSHLQNMRHGTLGKRISKANKISMIGKHNNPQKPVVGIKKDLTEILNYPSIMEASIDRGFYQGAISKCCNNKSYKSVQGFYWFYKSDFYSYMKRFQGNLQDLINFKLSLY